MKDKWTRVDIFLHLFKWAIIECFDRFFAAIKQLFKEMKTIRSDSWKNSKDLHDFHKSKIKKPTFDEDEIYTLINNRMNKL